MKYNQLCHTMRNFGDANSEVKGVELYQVRKILKPKQYSINKLQCFFF